MDIVNKYFDPTFENSLSYNIIISSHIGLGSPVSTTSRGIIVQKWDLSMLINPAWSWSGPPEIWILGDLSISQSFSKDISPTLGTFG